MKCMCLNIPCVREPWQQQGRIRYRRMSRLQEVTDCLPLSRSSPQHTGRDIYIRKPVFFLKKRRKLTESDIKKMQEEIEYRKLVVRKEALEDVKEARAQGDLSENFEYYAAKKFKNKNEGRIRFLERMIKTAEVVSDESAADEVGMNNKVEVWFEEDDETETYKIVTTMRQDSLKGLISGESPLGKALLGHKVGDRVFVEIGAGDGYYVVIRSIDKSAGDDDELRSF